MSTNIQVIPTRREEQASLNFSDRWFPCGTAPDGARLYFDCGEKPGQSRFIERGTDGRFVVAKDLNIDWKRAPANLDEQFPTEEWGRHSATSTLPMSTIIALHRAVGRLQTNRDVWIGELVERELLRLDAEWKCNLFAVLNKDEPTPSAFKKKAEELKSTVKAASSTNRVQARSAWV